MNRRKLQNWHIRLIAILYTGLCSLLVVSTAFAHDSPPGDEYQMADWMLFSFLIFFGVAFIVFLAVLKRGLLSQPEDAKYYILTIDEKDYYTPSWALEKEEEEEERQNTKESKKEERNDQ